MEDYISFQTIALVNELRCVWAISSGVVHRANFDFPCTIATFDQS